MNELNESTLDRGLGYQGDDDRLLRKYSKNGWILMMCQVNRGLTHWGQVTHICISKLTNIGPDNGLSPGRRQAII